MKIGKPDQQLKDKIRYYLLGNPLKSSALHHERLGIFAALALFAVDALSSVAYATEEIILVLAPYPLLYPFSLPIACIIVLLMAMIVTSYIQTVHAFPNGGGAYTVSKTYLGSHVALIAASALLIDYILTVAVSVSAGVRSLASVFPALYPHSTFISVFFVCMLCALNLRGIRESAGLLMFPVYAYILGMLALCITGSILSWTGIYALPAPLPYAPPGASMEELTQSAMLLLLLRAFAGGCTAMTGIEAIANAGSMLKKPQAKTASIVLITMGLCLGLFFGGLTWITDAFQLHPLPKESLVSQITKTCWGNGFFYATFQMLITLILLFAANTAFAGFPKLASMLAEDSWLPRQLSALGDRLVFSNGVVVLAIIASTLIIIFQSDTHTLIPLYAIGVFLAFTLSQFGMAVHWFKVAKRPWRKIVINTAGTLCTFIVLLITLEAKFFEGAYVVSIILPLFWLLLIGTRKHYKRIDKFLSLSPGMDFKKYTKNFTKSPKRAVIVPIARFHLGALEALTLARELSSNVTALIIDIGNPAQKIEETSKQIQALNWGIHIEIIYSPYRSIIQPVVDFVHSIDRKYNHPAVLILPEFVLNKAWQEWLLHNHTARNIEKALGAFEILQGEARAIVKVPYYLPDAPPQGSSS
ncbi:MAG: APC family permease [Alphaproteobacteria bacterium]